MWMNIDVPFDCVITVYDNANEACPFFPGQVKRFHHNFPDPAKATGTADEVMNKFREVRDMVKAYSAYFVQQQLTIPQTI